jgi:hypothetical protein
MDDDKTYRSQSNEVLGEVEWYLEDCETKEILESGKRAITADEVLIHWQWQNPTHWLLKIFKALFVSRYGMYRKQVQLGDKSILEMCEFPKKRRAAIRGFGMSAKTENTCGEFCWEWFEIKSSTEAKKLQETGELTIRFEEVKSRWEVVHTDFLSDISFRISPCTTEKPKPENPKWRLNIRQGSYLNWPSVSDGQVIYTAQPAATAVSANAPPLVP